MSKLAPVRFIACEFCRAPINAEDGTTACVFCLASERNAPDDDEQRTELDDYEEDLAGCGALPGGGCSLAGTEYCDWNCPLK